MLFNGYYTTPVVCVEYIWILGNSLVIFTVDTLFNAGIMIIILSPKLFTHKSQTNSRNINIINNIINITSASCDSFNPPTPYGHILFIFPYPQILFFIKF